MEKSISIIQHDEEIEHELANYIFGPEPVRNFVTSRNTAFAFTDRKQFSLFCTRQVSLIEDRLNAQFGASMALLRQSTQFRGDDFARLFVSSEEFRHTREDLSAEQINSKERFEIGFLNFILAHFSNDVVFFQEFEKIFLLELSQK